MAPTNSCPKCQRALPDRTVSRCPKCGAAIGAGPAPRKKKKKKQPTGLSKKQITWIAVGVAAMTLFIVVGSITLLVVLARGGRGRSGPLGATGDFAVVDELPDPPTSVYPAEGPEPPEPPRDRMIWRAKPDPAANPIDYSNAFGGPTPEKYVLQAGLNGPFVVGVQWLADPKQRIKNAKTGDAAQPYKRVPQADAPYPVVDFRSGKEVGWFPAAAQLDRHARLSPDGQYAASWETQLDKTAREDARHDFLVIWKRGGDKPITRWPVPTRVLWFDFVAPDRIAIYLTDEAPKLVILDVVKGTEVVSRPLPAEEFPPRDISRRPQNRAPHFQDLRTVGGAVSPGGAYAVIPGVKSLVVVSTADGSIVGRLPLGDSANEFWGMGFDETGSELRAGFNFTIRTWSMRDGLTRHTVTLTNNPPKSCRLASGPEADTLIYGGTIIDLVTGKSFFGLPLEPLQWIKPDLLLAIAEPSQSMNAKEVQDSVDYQIGKGIFVVKFPRDRYQQAATPILAARPKAPAAPPSKNPVDRKSVATIHPKRDVAWALKLSGAPPLPADATLSEWPDLFAVNETAKIQGTRTWTRYELKSGKPIGEPVSLWPEVNIPIMSRRGRYAALSPDGKRLAVVDPADSAHVGVWDATGKRVIDFWPCSNQTIDWLDWSADGRLLAASQDLTTGWDAANGKAIFEIDARYSGWTIAPGAAWFVAATPGGALDLFDASTGKQLGHIRGTVKKRGFLIAPDGKMLVFPGRTGQGFALPLQVWDLETGRRSTAPESPMGPVFGHFIGPRRAISAPGNGSPDRRFLLYDFDLHTHTLGFDSVGAPEFRNDSLGRPWMKKRSEKVWKPVKIPGMEPFDKELAFGSGSIIRVEVDVAHSDYSQRIARQTAEQLQKHGLKIGRNGWVLRAEHQIGQSKVRLNNPVTGAAAANNFISLDVTWRLLSPDGVEVWKSSNSYSFDPFRSKYVVVGSRTNPGPQGGIRTVNLDFGNKNPVTAQIEELLETSILYGGFLPGMPLRVAKSADGFAPLPFQAKWE